MLTTGHTASSVLLSLLVTPSPSVPVAVSFQLPSLNSGFGATAPTGPSVLPLRSQPLFTRRPRPEAPLFWRFVGIGWREQRRLGGRRTELGALGKGVGQFGLGQSLQETASEGRGFVQAPKPEGTELRTSFYVLKASLPCSDLKIILILRPQPFHTRQRIRVCFGSRCVLICCVCPCLWSHCLPLHSLRGSREHTG